MEIDTIKDELLARVDSALKYGSSLDNQAEFEVYLYYEKNSVVETAGGILEGSSGRIAGHSIRVAKGTEGHKRLSSASSSTIEMGEVKKTLLEALKTVSTSTVEDPHFQCFCEPKQQYGKEGILNAEIVELSTSDIVNKVNEIEKNIKAFDTRISTVFGSYTSLWRGFAIGNNNGVQQASRNAFNHCYIGCITIDGTDRRSSDKFKIQRDKIIDNEEITNQVTHGATSLIGGRKLNRKVILPVLLNNVAAGAYIFSMSLHTSGQLVHDGRSALADKIGEEISIPGITIIDDGQNPRCHNTEVIDAEGSPQQKTPIIKKGILKQFMLNSYYAKLMDMESTGNCEREGQGSLNYEEPVSISPKNFKVIPGKKTEEEIISSFDGEAIYYECTHGRIWILPI